MGLGGVDHVIAVIEPMPDQGLDQRRRMLTVTVHEQHGAEPGVIEAGQQRSLLAEITRQRNHLDIERVGREPARNRQRVIPAAIVDINDFSDQPPAVAQRSRNLNDAGVQPGQVPGLVVDRDHDGQTSVCPSAWPRQGTRIAQNYRIGCHFWMPFGAFCGCRFI